MKVSCDHRCTVSKLLWSSAIMANLNSGLKRRRKNQDNFTMLDVIASKKPPNNASPVVKQFQGFQMELDNRYDKYERIVKHSRDITIQSKRAIFLLHRASDDVTRAETLQEAAGKFVVIKEIFKKIATELLSEDCYQYIKAYSPGLQEFIEAFSFWYYLKHGNLVSFEEVCKELLFENDTGTNPLHPQVPNPPDVLKVPIPPAEYILGISDLTGELMRLAINSVGQGNLTTPLEICQVLRQIHDDFMVFGDQHRGLAKKLEVMKNSLKKVENTCYMIHMRSSEVPQNMLATLLVSEPDVQ